MIRLRILVEGETEEDFVNEVLRDHLFKTGVVVTACHLGIGRSSRGIVSWQSASRHLRNTIREDSGLFVTTFVDYYALKNDWPGCLEAQQVAWNQRSEFFNGKVGEAMEAMMGDDWRSDQCFPFVMVHEFETLLFADPAGTAKAIGRDDLEAPIRKILEEFSSPEEINDLRETSPSHRMVKIFRDLEIGRYDKRVHGNVAALGVGFEALRLACPQFGNWLTWMEDLGNRT